jgi:lysophospholipase L1-like esterase
VHPLAYVAWGGWHYTTKACSGARTTHVLNSRFQSGNRDEAPQIQQLSDHIAAVDAIPRAVVFSIGGNDLDFAGAVKSCVADNLTPGPDRTCNRQLDAIKAQLDASNHYHRVSQVISAVRAATSSSTTIIVMGYPALFAKEPQGRTCPVNGAEARRTRRLTRATNAQADKAARELGAVFISTTPAFSGHHLCDGNGDNDWFVPISALAPQAAHPRVIGYKAEGQLLHDCLADLAACRQRYRERTATVSDRSRIGQGIWTVALEEDPESELATPGVPGAPTIAIVGDRYRISWPAVTNARWYELEGVESAGVSGFAQTDTTALDVLRSDAPAIGTCIHVTAFSDDEGEVTGPCVRLPAPPQPPTAQDALIGMCKNTLLSRSVAPYASDPDSAIASFRLVEISFATRTHQFAWSGNGGFSMKIPATTPTGTILTVKWQAVDTTGLASRVATLSIRAASC